ncbi:MBL fold metallo-hydrolase [uncultured Roseobacter sp.]|uniref:MBL fold metallo-hydrolase n=1 Tax=uncultured Roseobacter sp. TaxID=114847 RepID=UPI002608E88A|nr:MBL fold metallo-hydrolase [uncultured Roseobacter sp.]
MFPPLKGRPLRMAVLDYGLFQVHANGRIIGICGYLIQTDADETVLIDTGFPAKYADHAETASIEDDLTGFGRVLSITSDNLAPDQVALTGTDPAAITLMVQSHTHIDHIGFLHGFPGVPLVIAAAERALPRPLYWAGKQDMEWPERDCIELSGDAEIGPGFHAYLVPGHTPGQLAFLVELPKTGSVLLTSDAISRPAEIDEGFEGAWDTACAIESGARLMRIAEETKAMVIYGHCPVQWPGLKKAPEWYD